MAELSFPVRLLLFGLVPLIASTLAISNLASCGLKTEPEQVCVTIQAKRWNLLGYAGLYGDWSKNVYVKKPNATDPHQQWLIKPNLHGSMKLQNRNSTRCLCVRGQDQYWDGYRAHSCYCNGTNPEENWRLEAVPGQEACVYRLQSDYHQGYVFPSKLLQRVHADLREVKRGSTKGDWKLAPCPK
uniref:Hypothetical secreted protein n=1 Tax=Simulium nigrimanum TaxID=683695 RepID=D1FPU8_SIMNI